MDFPEAGKGFVEMPSPVKPDYSEADFLTPTDTQLSNVDLEQPRLSSYERINDEIRAKQAELQALGIELQLRGSLRTRKDVENETRKANEAINAQASRELQLNRSQYTNPFPTPLPTYKRSKENNKIQRETNKHLFGNPLDFRTQRPIVNRPGWNITRVLLGLGGTGV